MCKTYVTEFYFNIFFEIFNNLSDPSLTGFVSYNSGPKFLPGALKNST